MALNEMAPILAAISGADAALTTAAADAIRIALPPAVPVSADGGADRTPVSGWPHPAIATAIIAPDTPAAPCVAGVGGSP